MSKEITATINLAMSNAGMTPSLSKSVRVDQATARFAFGVQNIGTTAEQIVVPSDVATPGTAAFFNPDATHFIEIGVSVSGTFYPLTRVMPGEPQLFRLSPGVAVYARADTAAADLQFLILAN